MARILLIDGVDELDFDSSRRTLLTVLHEGRFDSYCYLNFTILELSFPAHLSDIAKCSPVFSGALSPVVSIVFVH